MISNCCTYDKHKKQGIVWMSCVSLLISHVDNYFGLKEKNNHQGERMIKI